MRKPPSVSSPSVLHRPTTLTETPTFKGSPQSAQEHMARRKASGLSHRAIAKEFNTSKSTSHRKVGGNALKQGFTKIAPISDD